MASPVTELRTALLTILNAEFSEIEFISDKLHPAVALDAPRGAVYPEQKNERQGRVIESTPIVYVQIFDKWDKRIDPEQIVDPAVIEGYADRAERAIRTAAPAATELNWFFRVTSTQFIDDPTGNRSRALLRVQAHGSNPAVVETGP